MCLGIVAGITTESSEFRASRGNCGLVVIRIGSGRTRSASTGGMFRDWRGSDSCFIAEGSGGTVGIGFAFEIGKIVHRVLSDKKGWEAKLPGC
jgi:hypothetical protein